MIAQRIFNDPVFDKKLLFDGTSIRNEKYTVKEKDRGQRQGDKGGLLGKMRPSRAGLYRDKGIWGKEEADLQNWGELPPPHLKLSLNGRVIFRNLEILIRRILIERKLGIRVVYLKFERFGFKWGLWLVCQKPKCLKIFLITIWSSILLITRIQSRQLGQAPSNIASV